MSEDAIITDAQMPINESGPYFSKIPSKVAIEALPEKGLNRTKGKSSLGIFKKPKIGDRYLLIIGSIPDDKNIETETISAHIVGKIAKELFIPFFAPLKKLSKYDFLPKNIIIATKKTTQGSTKSEIFLTISTYFTYNS